MKFSEMPYTRIDADAYTKAANEMIAAFKAAETAEEQLELYKKMDKLSTETFTNSSIAYTRFTINTKDEFYAAEREYNNEIGPRLEAVGQEFMKALLDSKFRPELEKALGNVIFINAELAAKGFSEEIIPLVQEENNLVAQYQAVTASAQIEFDGKICNLSQLGPYMQSTDRAVRKAAYEASGTFFDEHQEELDEIYDKLVKNRTEQAKKLGFNNFVELGFVRRQRNCYTPEDISAFRKQVVRDLVPIVKKIKERQAERIGVADLKYYDDNLQYPEGNATPQGTPDELLAAGKQMYTEMSEETGKFIEMMFDMDLFDVLSKPGKANGGYCITFDAYHCPFIFSNFNGTAADVDVLTHEAGHAFAAYVADRKIPYSDLRMPSMEGCETHSMSMEFFATPWYKLFFKDQTEKYEISHAEGTLNFIPYGCMVDHFQEIVYSHPELTPAQRNEEWLKLDRLYRPYLDAEDLPFYGRGAGWQRQLHIYTSPFYYIDYCLAQTVALQFWKEMEKDWDEAFKKYVAFVEQGGTKTFVDLVESVGLKSPITDGCLKEIAEHVEKWLDK